MTNRVSILQRLEAAAEEYKRLYTTGGMTELEAAQRAARSKDIPITDFPNDPVVNGIMLIAGNAVLLTFFIAIESMLAKFDPSASVRAA
jgi:hypothetical protein